MTEGDVVFAAVVEDGCCGPGGEDPPAGQGQLHRALVAGRDLGDMEAGDVVQVPLDVRTADLAGALRARRYRKRDSPISFPECCAVAYATIVKGVLATCDNTLAAVEVAEGVKVKVSR